MTIFFWGVIISVLIYLVVGLLAGRRVKDTSDFYVCGRNAPTLLITGTLFASMLSVSGFTGDQGWCYSGNITSLVLLNAICACGYVYGALVFGRYLRRSECPTMPEYFGTRFHDVRNRQVAGGITVISLTAYLLSSITGVGILMEELTGLPGWVCLLITWACFTGFTFYSGSEGVVITDTMMFLVFFAATLFSGYCIFHAQGGIGKLLPNLMANPAVPEGLLDYHGRVKGAEAEGVVDSLSYALTMGIVWFITVAVSPWQAGRNLMAKSEHVTFRAGSLAAIFTVVFLLYLNLQSIAVLNVNPALEDPQRVLIWASLNVTPKLVGTLMLTGIMAAGLSSASTFLSVMGFSVVLDLIPRHADDDKKSLRLSRYAMLGISVIVLGLSFLGLGGIREVCYFASTIIAASWAVPAIGSILSSKLSAAGARWAMIAGFLGFIVSKVLAEANVMSLGSILINFLDPFFIGLYLSLIFAVVGSRMYPVTQAETNYRMELLKTPKAEAVPREYQKDRRYGYLMILAGVATSLFLLFGWALPYNGWM